MRQRRRVGDAHDVAGGAQRRIFGFQPEHELPAGADIGGHARHTGGIAFQNHQRQGLADRRQHHQADLRHQLVDLLEAQELDLFFQAKAQGDVAALGGVLGRFIFRPGDPTFRVRQQVHHGAHGAHEGLHILDRHHPADQAQHLRRRRGTLFTQGGQALQVNPVGNVHGAFGQGAVGHLTQAVGLVQGDDPVCGLVAHAPERLEKADPEVTEIGYLRRVLLENAAVVLDPFALEQVDLALLGVDAVFGQEQRPAGMRLEDGAQKTRIAGGDSVIAARRNQVFRQTHHAPNRRVHDANGPEIVDKRRVGAKLPVLRRGVVPGGAAVQESRLVHAPARLQLRQQLREQFLRPRRSRRRAIAAAHGRMELRHGGEGRRVAFLLARWRRVLHVVDVVAFKMHHVGRQLVAHLAVVFAPAAEKADAEGVFGKAADDLIDPGRHAARHVGKRAFEQQHDVAGASAWKRRHTGPQ